MGFLDRSKNMLKGKGGRPPLEGLYLYFFALFCGYLIADLAILQVRPSLLSVKAPPPKPAKHREPVFALRQEYNTITDRNIFNSAGLIPPPLSSGDQGGDVEAAPVLSQLPIKLEGTIVSTDPKKSICTVSAKGKAETRAYRVSEEIEGLAKITLIERRRITFRNLNNNRLEYVEVPHDLKVSFGVKTEANSEVEKHGEFSFSIRRDDITKYTADLGSVLNQARMVPNIVPGSGGRVEGFRFVSIQPGSIYEKLGFKPQDVIKQVNGEPVNSPTKAMELYNSLKSENGINLVVERNGKEENFTYSISQ